MPWRRSIIAAAAIVGTAAVIANASPALAKGVNGQWELTPTTPGFAGETWEITDYCTPHCEQVDVNTTNGPFRAFGDYSSGFHTDRITKNVIAYCKDGTTQGGPADYNFTMDTSTGTGSGTMTLFPTAECVGVPRTSPDLPMVTETMKFRLTQTVQY